MQRKGFKDTLDNSERISHARCRLSGADGLMAVFGCMVLLEEEHNAGRIHGRAGAMADFRGHFAGGGGVAAGFGPAAATFAGGSGEVEAAVSYRIPGESRTTT